MLLPMIAALFSISHGLVVAPQLAPGRHPGRSASSRIRCSLFAEPTPEELAQKQRTEQRLTLVAERFDLDPIADRAEIAARAASSLPEEETGTWADLAFCSLRNVCFVAVLLWAVGAFPGPSSAADALPIRPFLDPLPAPAGEEGLDAETLDVLASIVVPFGVGGILVVLAASQYERLIDALSGDK